MSEMRERGAEEMGSTVDVLALEERLIRDRKGNIRESYIGAAARDFFIALIRESREAVKS